MAETATESITIAATREALWDIVLDMERYPEWAHDVKEAVVTRRDDAGRPLEVEFRSAAIGRSTHYTLAYDYTDAPGALRWTLVRGDIQKVIDGGYRFTPTADGGTDVQYDLEIELVVPMPGFVKRRAEVRILNTVKELKARAEA
jgi:ribosome-associated toxin RatA of RatAB toxin-antitoxin module